MLSTEKWPGLVGQDEVVRALRAAAAQPVHAYLFVGPPGSGKTAAARAFAALLLCPAGGEDGCETCRRVELGVHPDVSVFERQGAFLTIAQAREVTRASSRSAVEGGRSIVVLPEMHLARDSAPALLKTIEEPPPGTVFIILADFVPPELITVASRCARVDFRSLAPTEVAAVLVAEGLSPERAEALSQAAGGRLDRARLLANDPEAEARRRSWQALPSRLDGSGATVSALVDELVAMLERSTAPLAQRQEQEVAEAVARDNRLSSSSGGRGPRSGPRTGAKEVEERQRREQRRYRTDELRAGLAALSGAYRDRVMDGRMTPAKVAHAVGLIDALAADLAYNPGEALALTALLLKLDRLNA